MTANLSQLTLLLIAAIAIPVIALGIRASENLSDETTVTRIIGLPHRTLIANLALIAVITVPMLLLLSLSSSIVFYNTAIMISEYLTHTIIPRPTPSQATPLITPQLTLHTLLWTSLLLSLHQRMEP